MSREIGKITSTGFTQGLFPDLKGDESPLLVDGANLRFTSKSVQPFPGSLLKIPRQQALPVRGVLDTIINGVPHVFWGDRTKLYRWTQAGGVVEVGTGFNASHWVFERWGTWVLATNGVDPPQIYKGVNFNPIDLTGAPFSTCQHFLAWTQFMFALNCDTGDARVVISDRDNPEQYVSTPTNFATFKDLRDTESGIKAALLLNGQPVCYTNNELHELRFLGPPNILGTNKLLDDVGVLGPHAVCEVGRMHYGLGPRGMWVTDGAQWRPLGHGAILDELYSELNTDALDKVVAWHNHLTKHVVFFYPTIGSSENTRAIGFNYLDNNWTKLAFGRSAVADGAIFPGALLGDAFGNIWEQTSISDAAAQGVDTGQLEVDDALALEFGFGDLGFGDLGFGGLEDAS